MIRPLRTRHRAMIVMLAGIVPALFVLSLAMRRAVPASDVPPGGLVSTPPGAFEVVARDDHAWSGLSVRTTWLAGRGSPAARAVRLELLEDPKQPDLLVYWTLKAVESGRLTADAQLLGRIGDRQRVTWMLPHLERPHGGSLVLYSLAKQRVVAVAKLPDAFASPAP